MKKDSEYWIMWTALLLMMILSFYHLINGETVRGLVDLALYFIGLSALVYLKG